MAEEHSPELIAFGRCQDALRQAVHPDDLISKLFAEGIITLAEKDEASNYMLSNAKRVGIMLGFVGGKIANEGRVFHQLVRLLKFEPAYAGLARRLQNELQKAVEAKQAWPPSFHQPQPHSLPGSYSQPSAPEYPFDTQPMSLPEQQLYDHHGSPQQPYHPMPLPHPATTSPVQSQYGQPPFHQPPYAHQPPYSQGGYQQRYDQSPFVQPPRMPQQDSFRRPPENPSSYQQSNNIGRTIAQPQEVSAELGVNAVVEAEIEQSSLTRSEMVFATSDRKMSSSSSCSSMPSKQPPGELMVDAKFVEHEDVDCAELNVRSEECSIVSEEDISRFQEEEGGEGYNSLVPGTT